MRAIRELTQEEDWKTQDGRMTKNVARECAFLILRDIFPSFAVLSVPAVLLRKFPIIRTRKGQTATPANKFNSNEYCKIFNCGNNEMVEYDWLLTAPRSILER